MPRQASSAAPTRVVKICPNDWWARWFEFARHGDESRRATAVTKAQAANERLLRELFECNEKASFADICRVACERLRITLPDRFRRAKRYRGRVAHDDFGEAPPHPERSPLTMEEAVDAVGVQYEFHIIIRDRVASQMPGVSISEHDAASTRQEPHDVPPGSSPHLAPGQEVSYSAVTDAATALAFWQATVGTTRIAGRLDGSACEATLGSGIVANVILRGAGFLAATERGVYYFAESKTCLSTAGGMVSQFWHTLRSLLGAGLLLGLGSAVFLGGSLSLYDLMTRSLGVERVFESAAAAYWAIFPTVAVVTVGLCLGVCVWVMVFWVQPSIDVALSGGTPALGHLSWDRVSGISASASRIRISAGRDFLDLDHVRRGSTQPAAPGSWSSDVVLGLREWAEARMGGVQFDGVITGTSDLEVAGVAEKPIRYTLLGRCSVEFMDGGLRLSAEFKEAPILEVARGIAWVAALFPLENFVQSAVLVGGFPLMMWGAASEPISRALESGDYRWVAAAIFVIAVGELVLGVYCLRSDLRLYSVFSAGLREFQKTLGRGSLAAGFVARSDIISIVESGGDVDVMAASGRLQFRVAPSRAP